MPPAALTEEAFDHDAALKACAHGDRDALRRIYERESRYLLGVALRIVRDRAAAEDVLHDAFMAIWNRASSFDASRGAGRVLAAWGTAWRRWSRQDASVCCTLMWTAAPTVRSPSECKHHWAR